MFQDGVAAAAHTVSPWRAEVPHRALNQAGTVMATASSRGTGLPADSDAVEAITVPACQWAALGVSVADGDQPKVAPKDKTHAATMAVAT